MANDIELIIYLSKIMKGANKNKCSKNWNIYKAEPMIKVVLPNNITKHKSILMNLKMNLKTRTF